MRTKDTRDRNDFYDPTYKFDYPSHVPSERAVNSKGVRYALFSFLKHSCCERLTPILMCIFLPSRTQLRLIALSN